MVHPSLNMELQSPSPLKPKKIMRRNEPCWCGSGKKWKKCHKDRHLQKQDPIGKQHKEMIINQKSGVCLHPEASKATCSNLIKAHTIQRAGGLNAIAENGHVLSPKMGFQDIFRNEGKIILKSVGINNASTFMGFCSSHDNSLFELIENNTVTLNDEAAFLLAFRAIAYEFLTKKNELKNIAIKRDLDKGKNFDEQVFIQSNIHAYQTGLNRGMQDLERWKAMYDKVYIEKEYTSMPHYLIEFKSSLPFVCCGGFYPEVDFNGNRLQKLVGGDIDYEHVCLNISVIGKNSFLALGWKGIPNGPAEQFVKSFKELKNNEKPNAALILAVEQLENTYFKASWWNSLDKMHKDHLIKRMLSGTPFSPNRPESMYKELKKIITDIEIVGELENI